jgi:hypothetical protein
MNELQTIEQFMGIGFKTMLPPMALLRLGSAGWTYSIVQEPPLIPRPQPQKSTDELSLKKRPGRENLKTMGLG